MEFNCDTLCTSSVNETDANPSPDEVKGGTQNIDEAEAEAPQSGPEQVANSEFQPLVSDRKDDNLPENPPEVPGSLDTPASASTRKRMPSALAIAAAESAEVISRGRGRVRGPKISRCSRAAMSGRGRRGRGNRGRSGSASETFGAELDGNTLEPAAQCQPEADAEREEKPDSADDRMDPETGEDDKGDKAAADGKSRKSYVSTKQREVWSAEEHERFIEAVEKFGRKWKSVAEYVSTRTPVQIRSHAQKYYNKLSREGYQADIPPPRKKKKVGESSGAAERQPKQGQQGLAPPRDGSARELPAGAQDLVEGVSDAEAVGTGSGSGLSPALGSGNLGQQMEAPPGYEHHTIGWRAPGRGRMPLQPQQEMHVPEAFAGPRGAAMPRMGKLNPLHMGVMMQPCEERASCQPESQQDEWYPGGACQGPMGMAYRGMPEAMGMGGFGHASWQQGRQPEGEAVLDELEQVAEQASVDIGCRSAGRASGSCAEPRAEHYMGFEPGGPIPPLWYRTPKVNQSAGGFFGSFEPSPPGGAVEEPDAADELALVAGGFHVAGDDHHRSVMLDRMGMVGGNRFPQPNEMPPDMCGRDAMMGNPGEVDRMGFVEMPGMDHGMYSQAPIRQAYGVMPSHPGDGMDGSAFDQSCQGYNAGALVGSQAGLECMAATHPGAVPQQLQQWPDDAPPGCHDYC